MRVELDALAVRETQHAVVVQHRVHVLDPDRVYGAVEDDPFFLHRRVRDGVANQRRAEAVRPLVRHEVVLAVELAHLDALRVKHVRVYLLERLVLVAFLPKARQRGLEHPVARRLPAAGGADEHDAEANVKRLVQLYDFDDKLVHVLKRRFL